MAKQVRTTASTSKQYTAETILQLIDSLELAEREILFDRLARHPENQKGNAWWYASALGDAYSELSRRAAELRSRMEEELRLAESERNEAQERADKYLRGPETRAD